VWRPPFHSTQPMKATLSMNKLCCVETSTPLHSTHESNSLTQRLGCKSRLCLVLVWCMFWNDWEGESQFLMVLQWFAATW
jgi:hypothetical protein